VNQRYYSLDVFRGATVCLMILVNNPGSWGHIYPPLAHAPWHGLTPTDLVFPFFLFAVGNALSFVMPKFKAAGNAVFWKKIIKRTLLIFLIGLFLNWWPFSKWEGGEIVFRSWVDAKNPDNGVRILGVLQRIAICYFFASVIIYYLKLRGAFVTGLILLLLYWVICFIGNPSDPYSITGWYGNTIDKAVLHLAHMYKGEGVPFDPEGLLSTIPAITQVIMGFMVGDYIQKKARPPARAGTDGDDQALNISEGKTVGRGKSFEMLSNLFVAGIVLLLTGFCWDMVFPINKKIWTSSYVIYTTGLAIITIAIMIYLIEFKNYKGWPTKFFDVFGKNALFVFALSAFLPKVLALIRIENGLNEKGIMTYYNPWNWLYQKVLVNIPGDPRIGSLLYALCVITFMWAICYWMDKKKIYVRV
jgi:predicted acyltransferase